MKKQLQAALTARKNQVALLALSLATGLANASIVDYATLSTSVVAELTSGVTAAMAGVGVIWGARIGLNFVRSIWR